MAIIETFKLLLLLVWEDDIASESLSHEQIFAKCTGALSEYFIWIRRNDSAESEYEIVYHLLVEEISSYSI